MSFRKVARVGLMGILMAGTGYLAENINEKIDERMETYNQDFKDSSLTSKIINHPYTLGALNYSILVAGATMIGISIFYKSEENSLERNDGLLDGIAGVKKGIR